MTSSKLLIFYAGALYDTVNEWPRLFDQPEIYNGAYIYAPGRAHAFEPQDRHWYRPDGTPVLLEDVPPGLRMHVLLLT